MLLGKFGIGALRKTGSMAMQRPFKTGLLIGSSAVTAALGLMRSRITPEQMYNKANKYGPFGSEPYRRNQGRMPSNHMAHAGLGLSLSRLRHR